MNDVLLVITVALLSVSLVKALLAISNIQQTLRFLDESRETPQPGSSPPLLIVICALREEACLADTVGYLRSLDYTADRKRILVVTTEREFTSGHPGKGDGNTVKLAERLQRDHADVYHLHFPDPSGFKSDQLNFAVQRFCEVCPDWTAEETFLAFYDADSQPAPDVLRTFAAAAERNPECSVFQQSATYLKNFRDFDQLNPLSRFLLKAQSLKQTRFIFAYEIPRIRRVFRFCSGRTRSPLAMATFAPCVAHGLFVRVKLLKTLPFPTRYVPEDMFWGFVVSGLRNPIVLLPSLDSSETPGTVGEAFQQLVRWFQGPFLTIRYVRYLRQLDLETYHPERLRVSLMSLFGVYDAAVWLGTSFVWWFLIAMSVYLGGWILALTLTWLVLYQLGGYLLMKRFLPTDQRRPVPAAATLICGTLLLAVYSLPACFSILKLLVHSPFDTKTERGLHTPAESIRQVCLSDQIDVVSINH